MKRRWVVLLFALAACGYHSGFEPGTTKCAKTDGGDRCPKDFVCVLEVCVRPSDGGDDAARDARADVPTDAAGARGDGSDDSAADGPVDAAVDVAIDGDVDATSVDGPDDGGVADADNAPDVLVCPDNECQAHGGTFCANNGQVVICAQSAGCWNRQTSKDCTANQHCSATAQDCVCNPPPAGCCDGAGADCRARQFCDSDTVLATCVMYQGCLQVTGNTPCGSGQTCQAMNGTATCASPGP